MPVRILYLLATAAVLGCASGGGAGSSASGRNRALITTDELGEAHVTNAYDAIERLRPLWLRSHGATSINNPGTQYASVYVDGQRYGDLTTLRGLAIENIASMHYYSGAEGATRFGLQNTGGVIEVKMK